MYIQALGEVSPIKILMLDGRAPKGSDHPRGIQLGSLVEVEYKKIFHHLVSLKALPRAIS